MGHLENEVLVLVTVDFALLASNDDRCTMVRINDTVTDVVGHSDSSSSLLRISVHWRDEVHDLVPPDGPF